MNLLIDDMLGLLDRSGCTAGEQLIVVMSLFHAAVMELFPIADNESRRLAWKKLDAASRVLKGFLQETRH